MCMHIMSITFACVCAVLECVCWHAGVCVCVCVYVCVPACVCYQGAQVLSCVVTLVTFSQFVQNGQLTIRFSFTFLTLTV